MEEFATSARQEAKLSSKNTTMEYSAYLKSAQKEANLSEK